MLIATRPHHLAADRRRFMAGIAATLTAMVLPVPMTRADNFTPAIPGNSKLSTAEDKARIKRCKKNQSLLIKTETELDKKRRLRAKLRDDRKKARIDAEVAELGLKQTQKYIREIEREIKELQRKGNGAQTASGDSVADLNKQLKAHKARLGKDVDRSAKADGRVSDLTDKIRDCDAKIRELRLEITRLKRELTRDKC